MTLTRFPSKLELDVRCGEQACALTQTLSYRDRLCLKRPTSQHAHIRLFGTPYTPLVDQTPIDRSLVSDQVFQALCDSILAGSYGPGETLPTQRQLAADFGVNLAPVREAIKRLEQLRLVEVRQGDAMRVRNWRSNGGLDMVGHVIFGAAGMHRPTLCAVMEARAAMLAEVARLAADRRTDEHSQRLQELAGQIAGAESPQAAQALDFAFFTEMIGAAGNVVYMLIMNTLRDLYFAHAELFIAIFEDPEEPAPLYAAIAEAIAAGAGPAAAGQVAELAELQAGRLQDALA